MIWMSLQFEQDVIGYSVGCIPAMSDRHLFILAIGQFLPPEAIVFDVVDSLEVENRANSLD